MAFEPLRTDYKDAVWAGLRKYLMLKNEDDTISLKDVTRYTVYDEAFFGAEDANRINEAVNAIMASVEKGTDLYEAFTAFFEDQKKAFTAETDKRNEDFGRYLDGLEQTADADIAKMKDDYTAEIKNFENTQEAVYNTWFDHIKDQLSDDAAGNLQAQIDNDVFKSYRGDLDDIGTNPSNLKSGCYGTPNSDNTAMSLLISINRGRGSASGMQLLTNYQGDSVRVRSMVDNKRYSPWRQIAFAEDVVKQTDFKAFRNAIENYSTLATTSENYFYEDTPVYDVCSYGNFCVLAGADGIYSSTDSGKTWRKALSQTGLKFLKVSCGGDTPRFSAAGAGGVYYSNDYGMTWTRSTKVRSNIVDMNRDAGYPILAIDTVNLYKAGDIDDIWENLQIPVTSGDELFCALWHKNGYLFGGKKKLYRFKDPTFTTVDCNVSGPFFDMDKTTDAIYACIGANARNLYHSEDNGETWTIYNTPDIQFTGVSVYDDSLICAYNATQICVSVNGGATWKTFEHTQIHRAILNKRSIVVLSDKGYSVMQIQYEAGGLPAVVDGIYERSLLIEEPNSETVTIGSATAADSVIISGKAKKITLLVKKETSTATTGAAICQYIVLPTDEYGVTVPKLSALTGTLSTSHGSIAVSGSDILLKSVKGFSIKAIIDYKNY